MRGPIFILYSDIPWRREVLSMPLEEPDTYILYGMPELRNRGFRIRHNLDKHQSRRFRHAIRRRVNRMINYFVGIGGDWVTVFEHLPIINQSRMVFSTTDRVGIPLVLLKNLGLVHPPIMYASIGLPERISSIDHFRAKKFCRKAFKKVAKIICYGYEEAELLKIWLKESPSRVKFVPFGVKLNLFDTVVEYPASTDVISVGADPNRDYVLLMRIAARNPELHFRLITNQRNLSQIGQIPSNVEIKLNIRLAIVLEHILSASVVALPVKENSYSGATTTLLQSMAAAKPIVVSNVRAINHGYGLQDGYNCRLVEPGDDKAFDRAIKDLNNNVNFASQMGKAAKRTVIDRFSWDQYVTALDGIICEILDNH